MTVMLYEKLTSIKGIGPARAERLAAMGLFSLSDLIRFTPRGYLDFSKVTAASELVHGEYAAVSVEFIGIPKTVHVKGGMTITTVSIGDATGNLVATWYNQAYAARNIPREPGGYVMGRVDKRHGIRLVTPVFSKNLPGILPVYPLVKGLNQNNLRNAVRSGLDMGLPEVKDELGESICREFDLADIRYALSNIHFPADTAALERAKRRLAFEDALRFTLVLELLRAERKKQNGISFDIRGSKQSFLKQLPFTPTKAQLRVMDEIADDMNSGTPMNRLVQGDVGSGKTILAIYAMFIAMKNGYQSVLMAPTEILAEQHYKQLKAYFGDRTALVTGSMTTKERNEILNGIRSGRITAVTGTHALIESRVEFYRLGLVITDEQHRFGVNQRAKLGSKAAYPDVMIMSATPIPRTLSLILYGDLDVSIVDDMPPGRQPVTTHYVPHAKRVLMYRYIEGLIKKKGMQAYVVCPMIEDNDELVSVRSAESVFEELSKNLSVKTALMHGRMKNSEKEAVMEAFRRGEIDLLVSTTVIEVGVDVPNACIIAIESADRFGLAQLHQLRGRVGRGGGESFCFLLSESSSSTAKERLKTLVNTSDGFKIAEKDLLLRGPGEFMGTRQSGAAGLISAALMGDMNTLNEAHDAAVRLMSMDTPDAVKLKNAAMEQYRAIFENIAIN